MSSRSPCARCPVCGGEDVTMLLEIAGAPVMCHVLCRTAEEALGVRTEDIRLAFCNRCTHIWNQAFDPDAVRYTQNYDNSQQASPCFRAYLAALAKGLVERYGLQGKTVVEIGCGQGEFLKLLCESGVGRAIGFDPAFVPPWRDEATQGRVEVIRDEYSEKYVGQRAAFVCSRHVLEHLARPGDLLGTVRRALERSGGGGVFFEVPDAGDIVRGGGVWDIMYEHCSYFSSRSLAWALTESGFDVVRSRRLFGDQYLGVEASAGAAAVGRSRLARREAAQVWAAKLSERFRRKDEYWRRRLDHFERGARRVVVWGAGSKGVMFLNRLKGHGRIRYAVDLNPRKQGKYVPGTGTRIMPPEWLRAYRPHVVVAMNRIYRREIADKLRSLGLASEVLNA